MKKINFSLHLYFVISCNSLKSGKNEKNKIVLILEHLYQDSTYSLDYLEGRCYSWYNNYMHTWHKHYFFGKSETDFSLSAGIPGSFFEFRKDDLENIPEKK